MATTISITALNPESAPPADKSIRAVVSLYWPYSSSTKQCALLLADPDFRLRSRRGQVRVRFTGASATAVAQGRVGIGDEIVLQLGGAQWASEASGVSTPGKSVEGELVYRGQLDLLLVKKAGSNAIVDQGIRVDESTPPPEQHPTNETPLTGAKSSFLRNRFSDIDLVPIYSSPAFVKRQRLSGERFVKEAVYDPFADIERELRDEQPRKRQRISDVSSWRFTDRSPSPEKQVPDKQVQATEGTRQHATDVEDVGNNAGDIIGRRSASPAAPIGSDAPAQVSGTTMPPPPLPKLQLPDDPFIAQQTQQQSGEDGPSTPKLQPVPSYNLPLPSPFPVEQAQPTFPSQIEATKTSAEATPPDHRNQADESEDDVENEDSSDDSIRLEINPSIVALARQSQQLAEGKPVVTDTDMAEVAPTRDISASPAAQQNRTRQLAAFSRPRATQLEHDNDDDDDDFPRPTGIYAGLISPSHPGYNPDHPDYISDTEEDEQMEELYSREVQKSALATLDREGIKRHDWAVRPQTQPIMQRRSEDLELSQSSHTRSQPNPHLGPGANLGDPQKKTHVDAEVVQKPDRKTGTNSKDAVESLVDVASRKSTNTPTLKVAQKSSAPPLPTTTHTNEDVKTAKPKSVTSAKPAPSVQPPSVQPSSESITPQRSPGPARTPTQPKHIQRLFGFGGDGASDTPPSLKTSTPQSEKDRVMKRTYSSLFGFRPSPSPEKERVDRSLQTSVQAPKPVETKRREASFGFVASSPIDPPNIADQPVVESDRPEKDTAVVRETEGAHMPRTSQPPVQSPPPDMTSVAEQTGSSEPQATTDLQQQPGQLGGPGSSALDATVLEKLSSYTPSESEPPVSEPQNQPPNSQPATPPAASTSEQSISSPIQIMEPLETSIPGLGSDAGPPTTTEEAFASVDTAAATVVPASARQQSFDSVSPAGNDEGEVIPEDQQAEGGEHSIPDGPDARTRTITNKRSAVDGMPPPSSAPQRSLGSDKVVAPPSSTAPRPSQVEVIDLGSSDDESEEESDGADKVEEVADEPVAELVEEPLDEPDSYLDDDIDMTQGSPGFDEVDMSQRGVSADVEMLDEDLSVVEPPAVILQSSHPDPVIPETEPESFFAEQLQAEGLQVPATPTVEPPSQEAQPPSTGNFADTYRYFSFQSTTTDGHSAGEMSDEDDVPNVLESLQNAQREPEILVGQSGQNAQQRSVSFGESEELGQSHVPGTSIPQVSFADTPASEAGRPFSHELPSPEASQELSQSQQYETQHRLESQPFASQIALPTLPTPEVTNESLKVAASSIDSQESVPKKSRRSGRAITKAPVRRSPRKAQGASQPQPGEEAPEFLTQRSTTPDRRLSVTSSIDSSLLSPARKVPVRRSPRKSQAPASQQEEVVGGLEESIPPKSSQTRKSTRKSQAKVEVEEMKRASSVDEIVVSPVSKRSALRSEKPVDKLTANEEVANTPKPSTTRKSFGSRLGQVPDVISAWFSPRRSSRQQGEDKVEPHDDEPALRRSASSGFRTASGYYTPLSGLEKKLNPSSQSGIADATDVIAVVTNETKMPERSKGGPQHYFTVLRVTDLSLEDDESTLVEVFRPWHATLPVAQPGDVVLLRNFSVKSRKRQPYLLSTDQSAWLVWRFNDDGDSKAVKTSPRRPGTGAREEVNGPPVEFGDEERKRAKELRAWWQGLAGVRAARKD